MNVIQSIYDNVKSCIMMQACDVNGNTNVHVSEMFNCDNGPREGEILSPILFSLYVNDLSKFLEDNFCQGVIVDSCDENDVLFHVKMLLLMYADDTVLFASSKQQLQHSLDAYSKYCKTWNIDINVCKTKIMCFGRKVNHSFFLNGENIELVDSFVYLGVTFSRNGRFTQAIKHNIDKARKAMFTLRSTFKEKLIPIDCQIDLFVRTVEPVLLYGTEVWGLENIKILERFRLKVLKQILGIKNSTPSYMVYGETGLQPLIVKIKQRMLNYWYNLINGKHDKIAFQLFQLMLKDKIANNAHYKWLHQIENILNESGHSYLWVQQTANQMQINLIKKTISDQEQQHLESACNDSTKGKIYAYIKESWDTEYYISNLRDEQIKSLIKFRTCNNKLPVETGRYTNVPYEQRKCPFCKIHIGDEFHYLLECNEFDIVRKKYVKKYFYKHLNIYKYKQLMTSKNNDVLINLSLFIRTIMKRFH